MSKAFRESAIACAATAIQDFPTIDNSELYRYLEWLGYELKYDSLVTIASAVRTSMNLNKKGLGRRITIPKSDKRYIQKITKMKGKS